MSNKLNETLLDISAPFRRDRNLIPSDFLQLKRINEQLRSVDQQIAYDEGADIFDTIRDDEK